MKKSIKLRCVVCGKRLKLLPMEIVGTEPQNAMWDNCGVHEFIPGYGSQFDGVGFLIGICDDCIKDKQKQGLLITLN